MILLDQAFSLRVAQRLGFLQILDAFSLLSFQTLGQSEKQIAVAVVGIDADTLPGGGNAFWETGPVRPDLILKDLRAIFDGAEVPCTYYFELE